MAPVLEWEWELRTVNLSRRRVVPATAENPAVPSDESTDEPARSPQTRLKWAQLLKRVFEFDMSACPFPAPSHREFRTAPTLCPRH